MLSKMSDIKQSDDTIGILSKFLIKKSKIAPPFRSFTIPMMFETGIDEYRDIIEFAVSLGVIMKASSTYMFNDVNLGKGMNKAIEYLKSNKDTLDIIKDLCYTIINNKSIEIKEELIEETDNG
jgi:recombination protein RecA